MQDPTLTIEGWEAFIENCHITFKDIRAQAQILLKLATQKGSDILLAKKQKKIGGHRLCFGEHVPKKYPKSEKSGFVSCKPQNIAIRSLN